jgi:hypothetical protein
MTHFALPSMSLIFPRSSGSLSDVGVQLPFTAYILYNAYKSGLQATRIKKKSFLVQASVWKFLMDN